MGEEVASASAISMPTVSRVPISAVQRVSSESRSPRFASRTRDAQPLHAPVQRLARQAEFGRRLRHHAAGAAQRRLMASRSGSRLPSSPPLPAQRAGPGRRL
jgi:hypothetical protein